MLSEPRIQVSHRLSLPLFLVLSTESDPGNPNGNGSEPGNIFTTAGRGSRRTMIDLLQENVDIGRKIYERQGEILQAHNASGEEQAALISKIDVLIAQNEELMHRIPTAASRENLATQSDEIKVTIKMVRSSLKVSGSSNL